ncbi:MAG: hypothetical protein ACRD4Y_04985, partial [Candidatus Acidiferrales bacterium]
MRNSKWKVLAGLALLVFILLAVGVYANFQAGSSAREDSGSVQQTIPAATAADSNNAAGNSSKYDADLAPGEGKE